MVSDTRSARKSRDKLDGRGSKPKVNMIKDPLVRSPGNPGRASTARQTTESPPSVRKSKRLEKETPPLTPPVKRTSERLGKCNTPNSLRRSDRGKKESSSHSVSKVSAEDPLSKLKKKKEKPVIQVTMESEKAELDLEVVGMKRKKMNARKFKSLFKKQKIQEIVPDGVDELERSENLVDVCSDNSSRGISSQANEDTEDVGDDENINEVSEGARPNSDLRDHQADAENDSSVDAESASLVCENLNLEGTCLLCSKSKRVRYDSPEQELCSCMPVGDDLVGVATCKARSDLGAAVISESTGEVDSGHPLTKRHADSHTDGAEKLCGFCGKDGDLLCCEGKSCMNCYHLYCLDPPLTDVLPGVWHCPQCVKKKLLFGVYSVSDGIESIWDVREVEVPNAKGVQQKQYLVKYRGLAHIHNHWVPEKQLLLENPGLVSNFLENNQVVRWNAEWMVPHRLLRKRPILDNIYIASDSDIWACEYVWLVKWRGLNYDHATWELDNSNFLVSSLGQDLVRNYEVRRGKAKQEANKLYSESSVGYSEIPGQSHETHVLKNVNKLRESLFKCPSAVVFYDQIQEPITTAILLVHSMIKTFQPFLIITTSESRSGWEASFERLVPSVDVVVYSGSRDNRDMIRASEFYDGGGHMIVQVLLSSVEAVLEDLEILKSIKWKAIVIDEYQYSGIADELERIKMLSTDMRILLVNGQIKEATSEYLKILSLVEHHSDFNKLRSQKHETNDDLNKLKDRLSRFMVYGRPSQVSKFIEYWVPVQISNLQLEHYCDTLLSHSNTFCACSRKVGLLPDILLTVRKCCHHPYLVDTSVQARLIADKHPANEILDIGIKASGKLQLLDVMLTEIMRRGLRVLILYQQLIGSELLTSGSILDDVVNRKFGLNTFERIDAALSPSEKQAAVNRFNKKETGQFVFLLENRACSSSIKLSSLDVVVIFDSDWNPANDLKALNKISIDSKAEQVKIFRLYSSFTIEERALVLAKQNLNLDHNISRSTCNTLLSWGATNLFRKLDEYHANGSSSLALNFSSEQSLLDEVTKEFQAILSEKFETADSNSVISEAKLDVGSYRTTKPMFGESKVQMEDGEVSNVFWRNLFEGKNPPWKHLKSPSPRNRKKVHYWEGSPSNSEAEKDNLANKRRKLVNESLGPATSQVELGDPGPSATKSCNQSENFPRDSQSSLGAEVSVSAASKERIVPSDEPQSIHGVLLREMKTLCQNLKLPENVIQVAELFLEYVIKNHHVSSNSTSIVQAFQISLCWVAASITKQKVDKKETLMLARQLLDYQCTEEEASSVYSKMRSLKRLYLQCSDNITRLKRYCLSAEVESAELGIGEKTANKEHAESPILTQQNVELKDKAGDDEKIKKIQKKCDKQMKKLLQEHQEQIQELERTWEAKRVKLETDHKLGSAFVRAIHAQASVGVDKLKILNDKFKEDIQVNSMLKDAELKTLELEHLAAINEEKQKAAFLLAKAKVCSNEPRVINGHQSLSSQSNDDAGGPQPSTHDNVVPSISSSSAPVEATCCDTPVKGLVTINSENEVGVESSAVASEPEVAASGCLHTPGQPSLPAEKTTISPDCRDMLPQNDSDVLLGEENRSAPQIEIATSEPTNSVTPVPPNLESPITDNIVTPEPSNKAPVDEVFGQLRSLSVDISLNCNESPATENHDQGRRSPQTAGLEGTEENLELHPDHLNAGPSGDFAIEQYAELPDRPNRTVPENDVAIPQEVVSTSQQPNQAVRENDVSIPPEVVTTSQQPNQAVRGNDVAIPQEVASTSGRQNQATTLADLDAGNLQELGFSLNPTHFLPSRKSPLSFLPDPLQNEIERMRKDAEQLEKHHADTMAQLKSDCAKEIEEMISQIRKKYELKFQEEEAEFKLKKNENDKNEKKVLLSKTLAAAFRSKCENRVALTNMQQVAGIPGLTRPPSVRPPTSQPARAQLTTTPAVQQLSRAHPVRSPPVAIRGVTPHPVQQGAAGVASSHSPRTPPVISSPRPSPVVSSPRPSPVISSPKPPPLVIGAMTSSNYRAAGEIRSAAPHLQPFRPPISGADSSLSAPPQLRPPQISSTPVQVPSQPGPLPQAPRPPSPNLAAQNSTEVQGGTPAPSHPPGFKQADRQPNLPENRNPSVPDISSTFHALEQSDLDMLGNVVGNNKSAAEPDVVCLSDDE